VGVGAGVGVGRGVGVSVVLAVGEGVGVGEGSLGDGVAIGVASGVTAGVSDAAAVGVTVTTHGGIAVCRRCSPTPCIALAVGVGSTSPQAEASTALTIKAMAQAILNPICALCQRRSALNRQAKTCHSERAERAKNLVPQARNGMLRSAQHDRPQKPVLSVKDLGRQGV